MHIARCNRRCRAEAPSPVSAVIGIWSGGAAERKALATGDSIPAAPSESTFAWMAPSPRLTQADGSPCPISSVLKVTSIQPASSTAASAERRYSLSPQMFSWPSPIGVQRQYGDPAGPLSLVALWPWPLSLLESLRC